MSPQVIVQIYYPGGILQLVRPESYGKELVKRWADLKCGTPDKPLRDYLLPHVIANDSCAFDLAAAYAVNYVPYGSTPIERMVNLMEQQVGDVRQGEEWKLDDNDDNETSED
jgi:hypothetical protein